MVSSGGDLDLVDKEVSVLVGLSVGIVELGSLTKFCNLIWFISSKDSFEILLGAHLQYIFRMGLLIKKEEVKFRDYPKQKRVLVFVDVWSLGSVFELTWSGQVRVGFQPPIPARKEGMVTQKW